MADLKTQPSDASVDQFIQAVPDEQRRQDAIALLVLSQEKMTGCRFTNIRFSKCFIEHLSVNN
jgi:hypothetical protein